MRKFCVLGIAGWMFFTPLSTPAKGPAKIAFKAQPAENRTRWESVVEKLRRNVMVNAEVEELAIEPVAAENSTRDHPTFRANLWLKCTGATQTKKLRANPSGMRAVVFERWILRAIQQRCHK